ncbi:fumarylacetoacetate hydrolase family protein [Phaeobacter gallaeciensis]|uniref:2-keto-4-pentenoate hydratase/2-oxohepta-3-ene-1,7-dioic acid hydratase (Catechol pathway) n=1 Tax=Phaeobacter gallaeciensis TaxID=60890 RepID=A0AAC9ZC63_9RHOB|nr:fumarylacetoacetate hydrolase family protein [Phaeobacter gallaeciensis]AHD11175.1 2-keto-4-pentenoate hydratase/2-oxohepta-3-ene-1,7-dioic acid hydratase (catechol pathway) [Phaeobacter gallaeciensis DSM 26640]ATE94438.1 2-keto-4-pentenoate hydratase/2-oxohepta-3-ene-1,7-dioic acid hydratase (catechol pathway) [Phaeobacter gallaeciensis]ATE98711.1 2-keto-4-pentenoate hydratase/2-oxohepta-3-ene-1,7-dioic acid hydratase (catechol pathway) [Phaeobacter gallaeciensis]ATF03102.1 2-keto-4-penteno
MVSPMFELPAKPVIPVEGQEAGFPVGRIFCVGRNYAAHAAEMGVEVDREKPFYFTKSAAHAVLSGAEVPYPQGTENFHHEMELVVAISAPLQDATASQARAAIWGYGCALDMTRRDLQLGERQKQRPWSLGKDLENGSVFAPLRAAADWGAPGQQRIWLRVNDEIRQDASLAELIWSVEEILCHLSRYYHLRPGDLVMTGTPAGVGPVVAGDYIEGGIDGLMPVRLTLR